ncbi:MAG: hypothetical protein KBF63_02950 [Rhodoferax sp.]|nr:hypothetical protein [Rhodoferax sp.]MBP9928204.1 hypothetical protein [Rhodoferax sp.]
MSPWGASRLLLTGLVLALAAASASAISIRELRGLEASDKDHGAIYVQYYLVGAMEGALEANAQVARSGGKASICLNGRKLEPRMAKPLFDAELKRNAGLYEADMPVQLVLLNALMSAYVC